MKIIALDIGDVWTGCAISDELQLVARPFQTVETSKLVNFLEPLIVQGTVGVIVVGHPRTMRGTSSDQTKKVERIKQDLEARFPGVQWLFWDERLSSKRAEQLKKARTKEEKIHSHSIAAAFILESYLVFRSMARAAHEDDENQSD